MVHNYRKFILIGFSLIILTLAALPTFAIITFGDDSSMIPRLWPRGDGGGSSEEVMDCGAIASIAPFNSGPPGGYNVNKNLIQVSQKEKTSWGQNSCAPTSGYIALEFIERNFGLDVTEATFTETVDKLRDKSYMNTQASGTSVPNMYEGLAKYLNSKNIKRNDIELDVYLNTGTGSSDFPTAGAFQYHKIGDSLNRSELLTSMVDCDLIIYSLKEVNTKGHVMVLKSIQTSTNSSADWFVAFSDPFTNATLHVKMNPQGQVVDRNNKPFLQQLVMTLDKQ